MLAWKPCLICTSRHTVHLQEIYLQRQETTTAQYYCMKCRSFFHQSNYAENDEAHRNDAQWLADHPSVENEIIAEEVVTRLGARRVFEAGCGVGDLLLAVERLGAAAQGVDPNPEAVMVAHQKGARVEAGYFSTLADPVDAIFALDVIEHVPDPRQFFHQLRDSVVDKGMIIVRVPEVNEADWHHLEGADRARDHVHTDPFIDNSVHINHFSAYGLEMMGESLGARYGGRIVGGCHLFRRL
ncbi:class I SAM-dependent methyltransferase [Sphingomonas glacialis]|uniref:Methyltransferase domain-containing protein n=1 Tax=Sphingomonas glacialis TaxID=658225 RepID=A0A502FQI1_9SPHN|nr:methyltransferase domain-containing protein [Sphingomonas glacialis]TPG51674.1 methyltransferase domain-containing protein [Sphingomonas glacialis]